MAVELRNKVILSVDESDYAEYAFDCEYNVYNTRGVPRIWEGGGQEFFFSDLGICMSPCALLGGFGGMLPRKIFFKTVQFGAF